MKYRGTISQRVLKRNNPETFKFVENEDEHNLEDLSEFHLDILTNALRERNWGAKIERLYGLTIFIALTLAGLTRKDISDNIPTRILSHKISNKILQSFFHFCPVTIPFGGHRS